jgi:hypothetical protein
MDELIDLIAAKIGLDRETTEKAVGIVLGLVKQSGDPAKVQLMFDAIPGAAELAAKHGGKPSGGGLFGALTSLAGPMAAMAKLKAAGLDTAQSKTLGQTLLAYAKEQCGEDVVKDVAKSIPGLSAYV